MGVNSLHKTVTRQRRGWDLNPGPSAPESSTLSTRLLSRPLYRVTNKWLLLLLQQSTPVNIILPVYCSFTFLPGLNFMSLVYVYVYVVWTVFHWLSCINTCACHVYFTINLLTHLLAYYYRHHPFNGPLSRTTWVSRYQKGKTSLDLNEARDDGVLGCSGIILTICKQSAPRSRQTTIPTPHHLIFTGRKLFLTPSQQYQSTFDL